MYLTSLLILFIHYKTCRHSDVVIIDRDPYHWVYNELPKITTCCAKCQIVSIVEL
jgi:hypothetical protein